MAGAFDSRMKYCSYCGKEYGDEVALCPLDNQPVTPRRGKSTGVIAVPPTAQDTFDVFLVSPFHSAGKYRVFVERSDLVFILVEGGSRSILEIVAPVFGPLGGALVSLIFWLSRKNKAQTNLKRLDGHRPEELLREDENNFQLYFAEIRDAVIEPPSILANKGKAGRLNLLVRHGEKFKFEFETEKEINNAIRLLTPLLNSTLRINTEWNPQNERFEKKRTGMGR